MLSICSFNRVNHTCAAIAALVLTSSLAAQTTQPLMQAESAQGSAPLRFTLTYDPAIAESFTGRVYVLLSTHGMGEPRFGPSWFSMDPFFAMDLKEWKPESPLVIGGRADAFPAPIGHVPEKEYSIQAVMRRNLDSPNIGDGEGNGYSKVLRQKVKGASQGNIGLRIDQIIGPLPADSPFRFRETERVKLVELRSGLLSDFHHRDIIMRAAVILPANYAKHEHWKYPGFYWIGGFGSDHRAASHMVREWAHTGHDDRIIRIVLDPLCYGGHHVFADSDNNGPRARALVEELIPYIESNYRLADDANARFLGGHSSGGWSSLWLQIAHPEFFGGVWSIAPDPIDFRDFQRINLYQRGANMYVDDQGQRRPLARNGEQVILWYHNFAKMDAVIGEGGQLRSFEWVFSKRGPDGKPQPLYDRQTGAVNPDVAETWKRYDIRMILEDYWPTMAPDLAGGAKLRVFAGELDTFYLEGAVRLFKQAMERMHSLAVVEIVAGKDHQSIASPQLRQRIDEELLAIFEKYHPDQIRPRAYD